MKHLYAYMITKDEAGRYLEETISALQELTDCVTVYDDRSEDETTSILEKYHIPYIIRAPNAPSFMKDESQFRWRAWKFMAAICDPRPGDWILTLDADEILRTSGPLIDLCAQAETFGLDALWLHVNELWSPSQIRTDGFWATIRALRLAAWKPNGDFRSTKMGGGSLPDYVKNAGETAKADILHYGYMRPEDRQAKYDRYSQKTGHSLQHIKSILQPPTLAKVPPLV